MSAPNVRDSNAAALSSLPADLTSSSNEVVRWQSALNETAQATLHQLAEFEPMNAGAQEWGMARQAFPQLRCGEVWFQKVVDASTDQAALVVRDQPTAPGRVLVDPNLLTRERGTPVSLDWFTPSPDGRYVVYAISEAGTEQAQVAILDVTTGELLPHKLTWDVRYAPSWLPDSSGFYFVTHESDHEGNFRPIVYRYSLDEGAHRQNLPEDTIFPRPVVSNDGRYVVVQTGNTGRRTEYIRISDDCWRPFLKGIPGTHVGDFYGDDFFAIVDDGHSRGRLVRVPVSTATEVSTWTELIPESNDVLWTIAVIGDRLVLGYLRDLAGGLCVTDLDGQLIVEVPMPTTGTISSMPHGMLQYGTPMFFSGQDEISFVFTRFDRSPAVYRYDVSDGRIEELTPPDAVIPDLTIESIEGISSDGTRIPARIVYRAGLDRSVPHSTLIHAYGGYRAALLPEYLGSKAAYVQAGGIYVHAALRGGGEFGADWWQQGRRQHKQNVFNDLFAIAEHLCASGVTTPSQLAVHGASNGGLLAGVAVVQRPDLWAAVVPEVPVLDLLNRAGYGQAISRIELGDPRIPEEAAWLLSYSPVYRVPDSATFPATLFVVGENDNRCPPWHAAKLFTQMAKVDPDADLLLRVHNDQGHRTPSRAAMALQAAEWLAFVAHHTGLAF